MENLHIGAYVYTGIYKNVLLLNDAIEYIENKDTEYKKMSN